MSDFSVNTGSQDSENVKPKELKDEIEEFDTQDDEALMELDASDVSKNLKAF